ncbi:hypothetical protein B0H14DRAFT_3155797 [Mycena olivaceomarginata]|nr:hypothetical protein B0H14DRAFT_3155797 [Mycena olivaceomarginata]
MVELAGPTNLNSDGPLNDQDTTNFGARGGKITAMARVWTAPNTRLEFSFTAWGPGGTVAVVSVRLAKMEPRMSSETGALNIRQFGWKHALLPQLLSIVCPGPRSDSHHGGCGTLSGGQAAGHFYWSVRAECQAVGAASSPHCQPGVLAAPSARQPDDCRRKSMPQVGSQFPSLINAVMVLGRHSRRDPA